MQQRAHARSRQPGQLGQRLLEEVEIAGEQGAQHKAGGELAGFAQMADQRRDFGAFGDRGEDHRGLLARLLRDALRPALLDPVSRDDEARERLGQLDHQ